MLVAVYFCTALLKSYHRLLITLRSGLLTIRTPQLFFSYSVDLHAVLYCTMQFWPKFSCQTFDSRVLWYAQWLQVVQVLWLQNKPKSVLCITAKHLHFNFFWCWTHCFQKSPEEKYSVAPFWIKLSCHVLFREKTSSWHPFQTSYTFSVFL